MQRDHESSESQRNVVKADDIKTEELPKTSTHRLQTNKPNNGVIRRDNSEQPIAKGAQQR